MASRSEFAKKTIEISDTDYNIFGIDCIWHNMDSRSDFSVFRTWYYCEMGDVLVFLADRLRHKIFDVLSVNATKHMIVITIATQKSQKEMLEKWLDRDYWIGGDSLDVANLGSNLPTQRVDEEGDKTLEG